MNQLIVAQNPLRQGDITRLRAVTRCLIMASMDNPLINRINERLKILNISSEEASKNAGLNRDTIRDLRRGKRENLTSKSLTRLATALKTTPSWLLGEDASTHDDGTQEQSGVRFGGIVEAGAFRRNDELNQDAELRMVPLTPDRRYPTKEQYGFKVVGDSMTEAKIFEGMLVLALDIHAWERFHGEPSDKQLVIVARTKNGDPERELTVKRLRIFRDRFELRPESKNPQHEPIIFNTPSLEDTEIEAQIIAVVINATWNYI